VLWCPKYRRRVFAPEVAARLETIVVDTADAHAAEIMEMEVRVNHVHLLVEVDSQYGIYRLVTGMKNYSSRLLRQEFPWLRSRLPTLGSHAYFVATVGDASATVVNHYMQLQKRYS
jgi:putative transposase